VSYYSNLFERAEWGWWMVYKRVIRRLFGELLEHKARRATNLLVSDVCLETHTRNDMFTHVSHPSKRERERERERRAAEKPEL
jgi:hypothetical protein